MLRAIAGVFLLCVTCLSQVPVSDDEVPQRKEILHNHRVTVSLLNLATGEATPMHKHDLDMLSIFVNGGRTQSTLFGHTPNSDKTEVGEVRFRNAGFVHAVRNEGAEPFRVVVVEFADPQGKTKKIGTTSHSCAAGKTKCVDEKNLFCTDRVCVEDVIMEPGAATSRHSHATDHMIIAVSDYEISDEVEGKGVVNRNHKSGEVEYIPAGITHRLTNNSKAPAHFSVIVWR